MNNDLLPQFRDKNIEELDIIRKRVGIVSFSYTADNSVMWAHYAAEHTGFVIGFDGTHPFFAGSADPDDVFNKLIPVQYVETGVDMWQAFALSMFFIKSSSWQYEQEVRMIVGLDRSLDTMTTEWGDTIFLVRFPPAAVRSVIVGAKSPPALRRQLMDSLSQDHLRHVQIYDATVSRSTYNVVITPGGAA